MARSNDLPVSTAGLLLAVVFGLALGILATSLVLAALAA